MSAEDPDLDNPELVHWSPRRGLPVGEAGTGVYVLALVGAAAIGAVAIGAIAVSALAISQLTLGRARLRDVRVGRLEVGDLLVKRRAARPF
jgi:hypothetical protein